MIFAFEYADSEHRNRPSSYYYNFRYLKRSDPGFREDTYGHIQNEDHTGVALKSCLSDDTQRLHYMLVKKHLL